MRVVTVPSEQQFLFDLLKQVEEEGLVLETQEGQQYMLLSLDDWQGFEVGNVSFEQEVASTSENRALMALLAERRSNEPRISLRDVKARLGLA